MPNAVTTNPAARKATVERWLRSGSSSSGWTFVTSTASRTAVTMTRSHRPNDWRRDDAAVSVTAIDVAYKRLLGRLGDVGGPGRHRSRGGRHADDHGRRRGPRGHRHREWSGVAARPRLRRGQGGLR